MVKMAELRIDKGVQRFLRRKGKNEKDAHETRPQNYISSV